MIDLEQYGVRTVGECVIPTCGRTMIPRQQWYNANQETRDSLTELGVARSQARGLCSTCYETARRAGTLEHYPQLQRPAGALQEEYDFIRDELPRGVSRNERLRVAGRRLGMSTNALDVALRRAGVAA